MLKIILFIIISGQIFSSRYLILARGLKHTTGVDCSSVAKIDNLNKKYFATPNFSRKIVCFEERTWIDLGLSYKPAGFINVICAGCCDIDRKISVKFTTKQEDYFFSHQISTDFCFNEPKNITIFSGCIVE